MPEGTTLKPLGGVRVLDLTTMPPGASAAVMLADLGADVVRVEPPAQKGKPSLVIGQVALGRAKRSLTLDQRAAAAAPVLLRLADWADVILENARPGTMEARGFGYAQAKAVNPGLIWCAITGFGQDGPFSDRSGHDLNYLAQSGFLGALSSDRDWHPAAPLTLQVGGLVAVIAVQAALLRRETTNEGSFVDTSLAEAATWLLTCGMNPFSSKPFALPASPDRRLYACSDGRQVAVACAEPRTWAILCNGLGVPDLLDTLHKWEDMAAVSTRLAAIFMTAPAAHWVDLLGPQGAAITLVNHASHVLEDPHVQARNGVVTIAGQPVPATPIRIRGTEGQQTATSLRPPPVVGEHTEAVLREAGFSDGEVQELMKAALI